MYGRSRQGHKAFVSYSHKDEAYLREFRPYLKSLADRGLIDFWSDQRIEPSARWHDEIQAAMGSAAAAVLLVSQDFLASDYIREYELPPLLRAREEKGLPLACLFVKPSLVHHEGIVFDTGSAGKPVRLTDYQGLNDPTRPLSAMDENERARTYVAAATWLSQVVPASPRQERFHQPAPGQRRDLGIRLEVTRGYLVRTYYSAAAKLTEHRSPWPPLQERIRPWTSRAPFALSQGLGNTLFRLLFDDDKVSQEVLAATFESAGGVAPRPILHPVRVRIETEEPLLRELSWHRTAWEGKRLWESAGWTFELAPASPQAAGSARSDVLLKAPCPVLLVACDRQERFQVDAHFRAVTELLHRAWPAYTEPPRLARDGVGIEQACRERRPRIVYCFADGPELRVPATPGSDAATRPLVEILRTAAAAPQVLFINLVHDGPLQGIEAIAALQPDVPLMVRQSSADPAELQASALEWLHVLLEEGEDADPVCAFHEHGVPQGTVWGAYGQWRTRTANEPPREKLAHLLLDRKLQRAVVRSALDELLHEGDRRLCCLFAYGAQGNLVDRLPDQLLEHLRRTAQGSAYVRRVNLRLPAGTPAFNAGVVETQVRRDLDLGPRTSMREALLARRPRAPQASRPILFLDWGVRGGTRDPIDPAGLTAWLEFCAGPLCADCPPELRLLSLLSLESPKERHPRIESLMNELRAQPRFRDRAFRLERLEPLDQMTANDLADFLDRKGNSSCPDDLIPVMPELIIADTGGHFELTVARIEEAERRSWYALHDELMESARHRAPAGTLPPEEGGPL
jgi:hypothetical protein